MLVFASAPFQFNQQRPRRSYYNTQPTFYGFNDLGYGEYVSLREIDQQRQAEIEQHCVILHLQEVERRQQLQIQAELERQAAHRDYIARLNGLDDLFEIALEDETPGRFQFARRGGGRCGTRGYGCHKPRYTDEDVLASIMGLSTPSAEATQEGPHYRKKVRFAPSQERAKAAPTSEVDQFENFLSSLFGGQLQQAGVDARREEVKANPTQQDARVQQLQNFFEAMFGVAQPSKEEAAPQKVEAKIPRQQEKQPEAAPTATPSKSSELEEFVAALLSTPSLFPSKDELTRKEDSEKPACARVPRNPRPNRFYRWCAHEVSRPECEWRRRRAMKTTANPVSVSVPVEVREKEIEPAPSVNPVTKPAEIDSDGKPANPELTHRVSLAKLSSIKSSLSSLTPPHSPSLLPKQETKAYEEALMKVLERLDGVESNGDDEVREVRRSLVRAVEGELGRIDLERCVGVVPPQEAEESVPAAANEEKEAVVAQEVIPALVDDTQKDALVTAAPSPDVNEPAVTDTGDTVDVVEPELDQEARDAPATVEENEEESTPAIIRLDNDEPKAVDEAPYISKAKDVDQVTHSEPEHPLSAVPVSEIENIQSGAGAESSPSVVDWNAELDAATPARPPNPEPEEDEDDSDVRSLSSESSFDPSEFDKTNGLPHYHSMPDIAAAADNMKEASKSLPSLASPEAATGSSEGEEESEGLDDDTVLLSSGSDDEGNGDKFEMVA